MLTEIASSAAELLPHVAFTWVSGPAAIAGLRDEWQELAIETQADIYMTPDWCSIWWRHFGNGRNLILLVLRQGERLVGVLPFCIDTFGQGPLRFRVARLAGTDPHCIVFTLPVVSYLTADAIREAEAHLLGDAGCDAISLTPLSERADFLPLVRGTIGSTGLLLTESLEGTHVMFDLAPSFDGYLAQVSRNRRSQFRSDLKGLEKKFAVESRGFVPDSQEFRDFVAFHNRQWQALGAGGHFVDWPGSTEFYSDIVASSTPDWGVRLDVVEGHDAGGPVEQLAAVFSLVAGRTSHARLPARTLDAEAQKLGIGKVSLMLAIRNATAAGFARIEGGRGKYDYKLSLGGKDVPVLRMLITRNTPVARARLGVMIFLADLLDVLHYKIWFKRITPRLRKLTGGSPKTLWRLWVRTRI